MTGLLEDISSRHELDLKPSEGLAGGRTDNIDRSGRRKINWERVSSSWSNLNTDVGCSVSTEVEPHRSIGSVLEKEELTTAVESSYLLRSTASGDRAVSDCPGGPSSISCHALFLCEYVRHPHREVAKSCIAPKYMLSRAYVWRVCKIYFRKFLPCIFIGIC